MIIGLFVVGISFILVSDEVTQDRNSDSLAVLALI